MVMKLTIRTIVIILAALFTATPHIQAKQLNDKLANRPYADLRPWHLGFSIGLHTEDVTFSHNGIPTEQGETWFMEQPSFSPGFSVNALLELRLNTYFSLRFSPGMYFGNRVIKMVDTTGGNKQSQNMKSTFVVLPVDIKFASQRFRNLRPYVTTGVMPALDVAKKRSDFLKFNTTDIYLTVGFGVDFYLPYFKFIPELKFCFGLTDVLKHKRPDLADDPDKQKYTMALDRATSQMVVLTFYFE